MRRKIKKKFSRNVIKKILSLVLAISWLFSGWPRIWNFPPEIKETRAAQVTIDATVHTTAASHNGGSPTTVFISQSTGYAFYRDSGGGCVYSKTTDGGATWGAAVTVNSNTSCIQIAVWYDRWTPGDTTGNLIHIATIDTTNDDIFYRYLDTSSDTLSTGPVNITSGLAYAGTLGAGANHVAIAKATDNRLFAVVTDASDNMMVTCTTSCTTAGNWSVSEPASWTTGTDFQILIPQLSGQMVFLWWDVSVSTNDIKYSLWNGSSWSAFANIDTALENGTYDASWGAAVDSSTGDVYLAYAAQATTLGTDDDVRVRKFNGTSWSTLADVITDSACAGVSNCGITGAKIARDNNTGYLYVMYTAQSTPGTATTANLYWKYSTDNGSTWSSEFGPVYSTNDDIYGGRLSLMADSSQRIYATWYAATPGDLFGKPVAPKTFEQSAYRFFNNAESTDVGTSLTLTQDSPATLSSSGAAFRLRMLLHIGVSDLFTNEGSFKLQFAQRGADNQCDTAFSGETYSDVTTSTAIAFYDNPTPTDGSALTANANDPTHGADTIVNQTYEEANNFTNSVAAIPSTQDGKWDFSLIDNSAPAGTTYCFRIVKSDDSLLDTYSVIPQITTATATTTYTQNDFEWFVDEASVTLTDPWPSGSLDLAENEVFTQLPATKRPLVSGDKIRIQINITVGGANLSAGTQAFQLEYVAASDCTSATGWTTVGAVGSATIWRFFDNTSLTDGATQVNQISTSTSGAEGRYLESNSASWTNPNAVNSGQSMEWDFAIENNGASENTTYCFRVAKYGGTALDTYNSDSYPKLTTAPGISNLMRHGNFFQGGSEKGFYWVN